MLIQNAKIYKILRQAKTLDGACIWEYFKEINIELTFYKYHFTLQSVKLPISPVRALSSVSFSDIICGNGATVLIDLQTQ